MTLWTSSYQSPSDEFVLLYTRELPGGGMVTIEAQPEGTPSVQARVSVERRTDPKRREGHVPPVIAEARSSTQASAFKELYGIAADNVAVARGLIQWQARRRAD
ncbi:MAG TPA: hypothetical protein VMT93_09520 [Gemmatimonadaceae bacterium]|nr:hypothetical protein [Gemmatimonadaceae bacterium]